MSQDNGGFEGYQAPTPVHYSQDYGVHADLGESPDKVHLQFEGQTNLSVFRIGGRPSFENDSALFGMGGRIHDGSDSE